MSGIMYLVTINDISKLNGQNCAVNVLIFEQDVAKNGIVIYPFRGNHLSGRREHVKMLLLSKSRALLLHRQHESFVIVFY